MQVYFTVKTCLFDIFQSGCSIKAHKLLFWSSKLQFFPIIWYALRCMMQCKWG